MSRTIDPEAATVIASGDISAGRLIVAFKNGNRNYVIDVLDASPACVTALVLYRGIFEKAFDKSDASTIVNLLMDRQTERNHERT